MLRKILFWFHLSAGVTAGLFIFVMAVTGAMLAFERQVTEYADRDVRSVAVPNGLAAHSIGDLLRTVRLAGVGQPTAVLVHNQPQASIELNIGRSKTVFVDPYSAAVLGSSSASAREFFSTVERFHRALGAPLGSKSLGRWLIGTANLAFAALIIPGLFLWLPKVWSWKAIRAAALLRFKLTGRAREWNWHNAIGLWCALPLLVISLSGVVMSFDWANALLFKLSGSPMPVRGGGPPRLGERGGAGAEPDYDAVLMAAKKLNPAWKSISLNVAHGANAPVSVSVDTGEGGQPQDRTQYLIASDSGAILKRTGFDDGSLGQRLRTFVRFGHTGEFFGFTGQIIAAIASLGCCFLVYTGIALALRRLANARPRRVLAAENNLLRMEQASR